MRCTLLLPLCGCLFLLSGPTLAATTDDTVAVHRGATSAGPFAPHHFKGDLRDLDLARRWQPGDPIKEIPRRNNHQGKETPPGKPANPVVTGIDPLLAQQQGAVRAGGSNLGPGLNFPGQGFSGAQPPDTVGDVGVNYYIQMVNAGGGAQMTIYHKSSGEVAAGPLFIDTFGAGNCASGLGDPVVLFDEMAGRWLLSEFSAVGNKLCVYVSASTDPIAGGWYNYEFQAPGFPDYPKYAVWSDAYYLSSNESSPATYALERDAMLAGAPASMQRLTAPSLAGFGFQALQPADIDGMTPPAAGEPAIFMRHRDDEVHNTGANDPAADFLEMFEFHVDWDDPGMTTLTGPMPLPISEIDSSLCGLFSFSCFAQPNGVQLDPLREVVMWRAVYRNFGSHEALVGNLVTDVDSSDHGGIRWFELRRSGGGRWVLQQEGTYAPDALNRWMGSAAMDGDGNIMVGYNIVSPTTNPGLRVNGRLAGDPPGVLTQGESVLINGAGSNSSNRWGDYASLNLDPEDDCTFWFTGEYGETGNVWGTRIGSWRFDSCGEPGFTLSVATPDLAMCTPGSAAPVLLSVGELQSFSNPVQLDFEALPAGLSGSFSVNPVTPGEQSEVSLSGDTTLAAGNHVLSVRGTAEDAPERSLELRLTVVDAVPESALLLQPGDGSDGVDVTPTFSWIKPAQADSFLLEVATDPEFANVIFSVETDLSQWPLTEPLQPDTQYYWRVRSTNLCGDGAYSATAGFRTANLICAFPALSIPDGNAAGVSDDMDIALAGQIEELAISITASHTWVGDLEFSLEHIATGTLVTVIDRPGVPASGFGCSGTNIDVRLLDSERNSVEDACAPGVPAIGGELKPQEPLATFNGLELSGPWRLHMADHVAQDAGTLDAWCLDAIVIPPFTDQDGDGIADAEDNCTAAANPDQRDSNGDGYGNACDADLDNNGYVNFLDMGILSLGYGAGSGDPEFDEDADLDGDGRIGSTDLELMQLAFFGRPGPSAQVP